MIYLFYGTQEYLIKKEIEKINKNFNDYSTYKYDLNNIDIKQILDYCQTASLFDEKKLVIVDNATMFTAVKVNTDLLLEYINNPNPNATVIFIVHNDKIDSRKKITKSISNIKEFNETVSPNTIIQREFKGYNISPSTISLLKERVGNNPQTLLNEIEKIKIYKDKDTNITDDDIINLTHKNIDNDIFKLIDYIVTNNKDKALELYHEMLVLNEEPIKIIIILAGQFRLMYQAKELLKRGYTEKDIASTLNVHPYRVKLAIQNGRKYDSEILLDYLSDLADIDIAIKTGKIDKELALELFILKK